MNTIASRLENRRYDRPASPIHALSTNQVIVDPSKFPIKPSHLAEKGSLMSSFGNSETEATASWLRNFALRVLAKSGDVFRPFTYGEINDIYHETFPNSNIHMNRMVTPQGSFYIQQGTIHEGGGFLVTPCQRRHEDFDKRDYYDKPCDDDTLYFWTTDLVVRLFDHVGNHEAIDEETAYRALCGGSEVGCSAIPSRWISDSSRGCLTDDPEVERTILETVQDRWETCLPQSIAAEFLQQTE